MIIQWNDFFWPILINFFLYLDENITDSELANENILLPNVISSPTLQTGSGTSNNENFRFNIIQEFEKRVDKFNVIGEETVMKIDKIPNDENVLTWLETVMKDVYTYIMINTSNDQFIGIQSSLLIRGGSVPKKYRV